MCGRYSARARHRTPSRWCRGCWSTRRARGCLRCRHARTAFSTSCVSRTRACPTVARFHRCSTSPTTNWPSSPVSTTSSSHVRSPHPLPTTLLIPTRKVHYIYTRQSKYLVRERLYPRYQKCQLSIAIKVNFTSFGHVI